MRKRAGLARALALDPDLLFLDEPTAGLDPIGAAAFDELILTLQKALGFTVFLITHDLDTLYAICNRVAVLAGDQRHPLVGQALELQRGLDRHAGMRGREDVHDDLGGHAADSRRRPRAACPGAR